MRTEPQWTYKAIDFFKRLWAAKIVNEMRMRNHKFSFIATGLRITANEEEPKIAQTCFSRCACSMVSCTYVCNVIHHRDGSSYIFAWKMKLYDIMQQTCQLTCSLGPCREGSTERKVRTPPFELIHLQIARKTRQMIFSFFKIFSPKDSPSGLFFQKILDPHL